MESAGPLIPQCTMDELRALTCLLEVLSYTTTFAFTCDAPSLRANSLSYDNLHSLMFRHESENLTFMNVSRFNDKCSFAHSAEEQAAWKAERDAKVPIYTHIRREHGSI